MDMKTIILSPHLDDAIYSCGGWIWEQAEKGADLEIWTVFAGDPPEGDLSDLARSLHNSWGLSEGVVQIRREEDHKACGMAGAIVRHLPFPDCIYRRSPGGEHFYQQGADIFSGLDPREAGLIDEVKDALLALLPDQAKLIVPLGIGNHVDHEVTRKAVTRLGRDLFYYADYPYAREPEGQEILRIMGESDEWQPEQAPLSEEGLERWWQTARAYGSQLSTFWEDEEALRQDLRDFSVTIGGFRLWEALEEDQ